MKKRYATCRQSEWKMQSSMKHAQKYQSMTNEELAYALINGPWAELPVFSEFSDLLEVVVDRLKGGE